MERIDQHIEREQDTCEDRIRTDHNSLGYSYVLTDCTGKLISTGHGYASLAELDRHIEAIMRRRQPA